MKYIIMCGGKYDFKTPKQLLKVNGEVLVERTIRLLRENGIEDIAITTNGNNFDYLDVEIIQNENNNFERNSKEETLNSKYCWLNAYYPMNDPTCYLHGDVYFSDEAIKTIINTKVKDTMFFCTYDWNDGEKDRRNFKGREPFAYKVENQKLFRSAINDILDMVDRGYFKGYLPPLSWHLYRYINNKHFTPMVKEYVEVNNIFNDDGDYVVINDYTTDIDEIEDVKVLEEWLKK